MTDGLEIAKVLIVDDRPDNLTVLEAVLDLPDIHILKASSGPEALKLARHNDLAVILLDVQMPTMDGFETARRLREIPNSHDVPIIFVTAIYSDDQYIHEGYAAGAVDYIFKPYNPYILRSKVAVFVDLFRKNKRLLRQEEVLRQSESRERSRQIAMLELRSLQREREVQQRYRDLVESIDHCIVWCADPATLKFTFISNRAQELTGYSPGEWIQEAGFLSKHLHEDDIEKVTSSLATMVKGQEVSFEHRIIAYDGRVLWFHTSARLLNKSTGPECEIRGISVDITAERNSVEELRQAQARLSRVVGVSPILLLAFDSDGTVTLAEGKGMAEAGFTSSQLLNRRIGDLFKDEPDILLGFQSALNGQEYRAEVQLKDSCFEAGFSPQKNHEGEIYGVVTVAHDITERKLAEADRQKFISLVETTSDFVFLAAPDGKITYVNKSGREMVGLQKNENEGHFGILDFFAIEDRIDVEKEVLPLVLRGVSWTGEKSYAHRSTGRQIPVALNILAIWDAQKEKVIALACIGRDITERKRVENEQRFLARVGALLTDFPDCENSFGKVSELIVPDHADLCFIRVLQDDGILKLITVKHESDETVKHLTQVEQSRPPSVNDSVGSGRVIRAMRTEVYSDLTGPQIEAVVFNEDKARFLKEQDYKSFICVPMISGSRAVGAISFWRKNNKVDSRELVLFEELGRRLAAAVENARLYQNAELAVHTRDEFLSIASHELKTPLTPLKLQFQTLMQLARDGKLATLSRERIEKMCDRCDRQISRLTGLIEDLLSVSRINLGRITLDLTSTDITKLITEVVDQFRDQLSEAKCELVMKLEQGLVGRWDPARLEQVLINLLTNAIKYAPGTPVEIYCRQENQEVLITIADHGIGIAVVDQKRIFDLFERAVPVRNYGGLGLGLYIVRNIVEAHGGVVTVSSLPGKGASFTVRLPLTSNFIFSKNQKSSQSLNHAEESLHLH